MSHNKLTHVNETGAAWHQPSPPAQPLAYHIGWLGRGRGRPGAPPCKEIHPRRRA